MANNHHDVKAASFAIRDLDTLQEAIDLCPSTRVAVQAGGHVGHFAMHLANQFERVHTFEADPRLFKMLVHNLSSTSNVAFYNAALRNARGACRTVQARRDGDTKRLAHSGVTHTVTDLDGLIHALHIDDLRLTSVDLIVLDIEGEEAGALLGAKSTLRICRPVVMVEVNDNLEAAGWTADAVANVLTSHDYELVKTIRSDQIWKPKEWADGQSRDGDGCSRG